jgi:hypothetical protein
MMNKRAKAESLCRRATRLWKEKKLDEAVKLFEEASALFPKWSSPLYNLGLLFKNERQWKQSMEYNRKAVAVDPKNEAAWWNFGIAATALGRWNLARLAWRGYGIDVPDGEGPLDFPCGYGPVRLNPDGDAEVVWAYRLDPARAKVASIPFPESGHRWGDVVLNDGAPVGYRKFEGKEYPVFNALELLERSPFATFVVRVKMPPQPELLGKLADTAASLEGSAEDWSTSVRILCKACSEGRPHKEHDTKAAPADNLHLIGVAARDRQHATQILSTWAAGAEGIHVEALDGDITAS